MRLTLHLSVAIAAILFLPRSALAAEKKKEKEPKLQVMCPVSDEEIDISFFVDHEGKRFYVCCKYCLQKAKRDPGKFIREMEKQGITLDKSPTELCTQCGEVKGAKKCCKAEGRGSCDKCGLLKGSPGCCKIPKDVKVPVLLCKECGEIEGSAPCCKPEDHPVCEKCGLQKGSPGCRLQK